MGLMDKPSTTKRGSTKSKKKLDIIDNDSNVEKNEISIINDEDILTNFTKQSVITEYKNKYSFYMMTTLSNFLNLLIPSEICNRSGAYLYIEKNYVCTMSVDPASVLIVKMRLNLDDIISYMFNIGQYEEFLFYMNGKDKASSILNGIGKNSNIEIFKLKNDTNLTIRYNGFALKFQQMESTDGDMMSSVAMRNANLERHTPNNEILIDSNKFLLFNTMVSKKLKNEGKETIAYSLYENDDGIISFSILDGGSIYTSNNTLNYSNLDNAPNITTMKKFDSSELKKYELVENSLSNFGIDFTNKIKDIILENVDIKMNIGFDTLLVIESGNASMIIANRPLESND